MEQGATASPRRTARITGGLYLLALVTAAFSELFISSRLVVPTDAAATATNIMAHPGLLQLALASYLIEMASQVAMTTLFYELLRPVNGGIARLSLVFGLTGCIIKTMSRVFFVSPLLVLGGAPYLGAFSAGQLQALALLFLKVNDTGTGIAMVFFGLHAPLKGYLILRSTFLPRILGVLGILGGVGWLSFLNAPFAHRLFPVTFLLGFVAAISQVVWLLVFGVNEQRWRQQALAATGRD